MKHPFHKVKGWFYTPPVSQCKSTNCFKYKHNRLYWTILNINSIWICAGIACAFITISYVLVGKFLG